jgi:hypothetical protein
MDVVPTLKMLNITLFVQNLPDEQLMLRARFAEDLLGFGL